MSRFLSPCQRFLSVVLLSAVMVPLAWAEANVHTVSLEQTLPLAGKVEASQTEAAPVPPASTAGLRILFDRYKNFQNDYDPRLHRIFTRLATLTFNDPAGGPEQRVTVNSHQLHDFLDALLAVNSELGSQADYSMVMLHAFTTPRHVGRISFYQTVNLSPDQSLRGELVAREDAKGSWRIQSGEFEVRDKSHLQKVMEKYQLTLKARQEAEEERIRAIEEARRQREQKQAIAEAEAAREAAEAAHQPATPAPVSSPKAKARPAPQPEPVSPAAVKSSAVTIPMAKPVASQPAKPAAKPAPQPQSKSAAQPATASSNAVPPWLRKQ